MQFVKVIDKLHNINFSITIHKEGILMKKVLFLIMIVIVTVSLSAKNKKDVKISEKVKSALTKLYPDAKNIQWTKDKKKTYCIYDAPSEAAIRKSAKVNGLPVDYITEVSVLDPYFYK